LEDASPRRLRENEEIMEAVNRKAEAALKRIRREDGFDADSPMDLFCECSDLQCRGRIRILPARFHELHRDPEQFVVLPGHEIPEIERVVGEEGVFLVVRKIV
jgi:hypothetical protein